MADFERWFIYLDQNDGTGILKIVDSITYKLACAFQTYLQVIREEGALPGKAIEKLIVIHQGLSAKLKDYENKINSMGSKHSDGAKDSNTLTQEEQMSIQSSATTAMDANLQEKKKTHQTYEELSLILQNPLSTTLPYPLKKQCLPTQSNMKSMNQLIQHAPKEGDPLQNLLPSLFETFFGKKEEPLAGIFGNYLQERATTFWFQDLFSYFVSMILGCVGYQTESTVRQAFIVALKNSVTSYQDSPITFNEVTNLIDHGLKTFSPRAPNGFDYQESLHCKLMAFKIEITTVHEQVVQGSVAPPTPQ